MLKTTLRVIRSLISNIQKSCDIVNKMAATAATTPEKRSLDVSADEETTSKRVKIDEEQKLLKRKVAMLMMYSGVGYMGMQRNIPFPTIEEDLLKALVDAGCIPEAHRESLQKMQFQRAARTDKGVSAAGQVVSLKMWSNIPNLLEKINQNLPDKIRILDFIRTTNNFNSKNSCSHRTYSYLVPTYAFTPVDEVTLQKNRIKEGVIDRVNQVLSLYVGTHNFHNFTSGKKADDPSAKRYIMSFECSQPFMRDEIEFAVITVKGQSFMLHQIRKMIGLMIAIVRGHTGEDSIKTAIQYPKFDVPRAPGLGLMLEYVHYDSYNTKFGDDGVHQKIEWEPYLNKIESFKHKHIYTSMIDEEKRNHLMLEWLTTLFCHKFTSAVEESEDCDQSITGIGRAKQLVWYLVKARKTEDDMTSSKQTDADVTVTSPEQIVTNGNKTEGSEEKVASASI